MRTGGQPAEMGAGDQHIPKFRQAKFLQRFCRSGGRRDESEFDETGFQRCDRLCGGMVGDAEADTGIAPAESLQHGSRTA